SSQPAYESNIVRRIDEYLDIHLLQQTRVGEDQDTLDDHDGFWLDDARFFQTRMRLEVVERQFNRFARPQPSHVIHEQLVVERVRMIEVRNTSVIQRKIGEVSVIGVLLNEDDFVGAD